MFANQPSVSGYAGAFTSFAYVLHSSLVQSGSFCDSMSFARLQLSVVQGPAGHPHGGLKYSRLQLRRLRR